MTNNHYAYCVCGYNFDTEYHAFDDGICTECGYFDARMMFGIEPDEFYTNYGDCDFWWFFDGVDRIAQIKATISSTGWVLGGEFHHAHGAYPTANPPGTTAYIDGTGALRINYVEDGHVRYVAYWTKTA